jgi:hypothetical protein
VAQSVIEKLATDKVHKTRSLTLSFIIGLAICTQLAITMFSGNGSRKRQAENRSYYEKTSASIKASLMRHDKPFTNPGKEPRFTRHAGSPDQGHRNETSK